MSQKHTKQFLLLTLIHFQLHIFIIFDTMLLVHMEYKFFGIIAFRQYKKFRWTKRNEAHRTTTENRRMKKKKIWNNSQCWSSSTLSRIPENKMKNSSGKNKRKGFDSVGVLFLFFSILFEFQSPTFGLIWMFFFLFIFFYFLYLRNTNFVRVAKESVRERTSERAPRTMSHRQS